MISKNQIEEAALNFNPVMKLDNEFIRNGFKKGAEFAIERIRCDILGIIALDGGIYSDGEIVDLICNYLENE